MSTNSVVGEEEKLDGKGGEGKTLGNKDSIRIIEVENDTIGNQMEIPVNQLASDNIIGNGHDCALIRRYLYHLLYCISMDVHEGNTSIPLRTRLFVYTSHFLSAWGDRMWQFGIGLFLVELDKDSLQLVAIYGFVTGATTLLLSTVLGDWVDRTSRLKAARVTLMTQNIFVAVCAVLVFVVNKFIEEIKTELPDEALLKICFAIIIALGVCANLASTANTIVIERDWVVELCQGDYNLLSSMTSTMRSIDLTTKLAAPIVTGQVIYFLSLGFGAVFVAGWNIISLVIEYWLIKKVYDQIPSLADQKFKYQRLKEETDERAPLIEKEEKSLSADNSVYHYGNQISTGSEICDDTQYMQNGEASHHKPSNVTKTNNMAPKEGTEKWHFCYTVFHSFIILFKGWKIFMRYKVAFAGLALACVYMTVIGFDNITVGYAYSQGISESLLGIFMAVGSLFGICATLAYPRIRRYFGLKTTGMIGSFVQIVCLTPCVVSVWLPGSPFDLFARDQETGNSSVIKFNDTTTIASFTNEMYTISGNSTVHSNDNPQSYVSIGVFLAGLIAARFGLWIIDLSVTQLFLHSVKEKERGIVGGVQSSLNQLMGMLKSLMVILAPNPEQFGLLILISFGFICLSLMLYIRFICSNRSISYN